jgi:hypothetical protein
MEKQESKKPLSNFPTATITTKYTQLWDTDSRGKARGLPEGSGEVFFLDTLSHRMSDMGVFRQSGATLVGFWQTAN